MRQPRMIPSQRLVGSRLQTPSGEDLGQVEDVILDPEYGRVAYLIASLSRLRQPDQLHAIPMEAIRLSPDGDRVMVTADPKLLQNAPAFERGRWPDVADPNWGTTLHGYYGYEPYWEARAPAAVVVPEVTAQRAHAGGSWPALAIVLLLVGAGLGYLIYAHGWPGARDRIASSAQAAFDTVEGTSKDAATTARVKTALALSKRVAAFDINVDSKSGRVTLSGQVPSEEMKEMAIVITRDTSGVTDVVNNLTVDSAIRPNATREGLGQRVADLEVRTMVRDGITKDADLKTANVDVAVQRGHVTLAGTVDTTAQKDKAERLAWAADGVSAVTNQLTVLKPQPGAETADSKLAKRVEFALYSTRAFDMPALQIRAHEGTVTLTGTVHVDAERMLAERIAKEIEGVRQVENNLSVLSASSPVR